MYKKRVAAWVPLLVSSVFLSACGSSEKTRGESLPVVAGVTVETVRLRLTPDIYEAVGTIRSATSSVLAAQLSGTVREIRVKPGGRGRAGQLLAVLDDRSPPRPASGCPGGRRAGDPGSG